MSFWVLDWGVDSGHIGTTQRTDPGRSENRVPFHSGPLRQRSLNYTLLFNPYT